MMQPIRLGILGSTRGTNMHALLAAIKQQQLAAEINVVLSNKESAPILSIAKEHAIPAIFINPVDLPRKDYDEKLSNMLEAHHVDLVVLIGYMRILSPEFIATWRNKLINVHPSLLPDFAGLMDQAVHLAVLDANRKETGCTVHYVTEEVDAGPIILQKKCPVLATDTVDSLKTRVQQLEGETLIAAINLLGKKQ